jgi:hypothetical protein
MGNCVYHELGIENSDQVNKQHDNMLTHIVKNL